LRCFGAGEGWDSHACPDSPVPCPAPLDLLRGFIF
jgi:hypothetical protein